MLKADISKAFDTVKWEFVWEAMRAVKIPEQIIKLVQACMRASRVTILLNGQGDGFIKPTRGLCQGCPLSPCLFILAMEFLSKEINQAIQTETIGGIKLARIAPPLTHMMYADDLIIMGRATRQEVGVFLQILQNFGRVSGLIINPEKSTVWFSDSCEDTTRIEMMQQLGAKEAAENEKYLGVIVSKASVQYRPTQYMLVDRIQSKLAGWKKNLLSHAGRATLIKSVISSIPVYYMSIEKLPTRTIQQIEGLMRRFLWGKLDKQRYLSLIAWNKVCADEENGGLGIRNVKQFNEALLLKLVWHLITNQDKIWVAIIKAKYCPQAGFWGIKSRSGTSLLWKAIQKLKSIMRERVKWHVGDGKSIIAVNQPWFQGWEQNQETQARRSTVTVSELYDQQQVSGDWR